MPIEKGSVESIESYTLPPRRLSGTKEEVLEQIDDVIRGLLGLRQLVSLHGAEPPRPERPRRRLRLVQRFINSIFVLAILIH